MCEKQDKLVPSGRHTMMRNVLARLEAEERKLIEDLISGTTIEPTLADIWDLPERPTSHWILVMSGLDHEDELAIAADLLQWREFSAKDSARVACIPSSNHTMYRLVTKTFTIARCPTLLVSDSPNMSSVIKIEPLLLDKLVSRRGSFRKVLTELHTLIEHGMALRDIAARLQREEFFEKLKIAYSEVKSLISITVQTDT